MDKQDWLMILAYFGIGGILTWLVNRRRSAAEARKSWTKYVVYFGIVMAMIVSIIYRYQHLVSYLVLATGAYEIVKVWREKKEGGVLLLAAGLILFAAIGFWFYLFMSSSIAANLQLSVYIIVLVFDGFSQTLGQWLGKTKLVPTISPGKTLEGLVGGLAMAFLTSRLISGPGSEWITTCFVTCLFAFAGDLLASYYKRKCGVKDYSNLLPGHGGMLDRFDSFIVAGAAWALIEIPLHPYLHG